MAQYVTNTVINKSISDYKVITQKIYDTLVEAIPEFNERSQVAFIHEIEWDPENDMLHIHFDYHGDKEPNGKAIVNLLRMSGLSNKGMNLVFNHDFYGYKERKKKRDKNYCQLSYVKTKHNERGKEYIKRPEVKERIRRYQKEYYRRLDVKERKKKYHQEYNKRSKVKDHKKEYQKEYRERPGIKDSLKNYNKEYFKKPEVKDRLNYNRYLKRHNLTKDQLSIEEWREKFKRK